MRRMLLATVAVLVLMLAACGEDDASDSQATAGGGGSKAQNVPEPMTTPPDKIPITEPLSAAPEKGKTLFWLQCELPICAKIAKGVKAATSAVGWNLETQVFKGAAPGAGMQAALQRKPDAIAITGIPPAAIKSELAAADKAGIPVVAGGDPQQPQPGGYMSVNGTTTGPDGEQMALWAIKDSGGKAKIVSVTIPSFPSLKTTTDGTEKIAKQYCSDCSTDVLGVTIDDLGAGQVASKLVAYLQSHPDVNYVAFTFADLEAGVPEALKAAGLDEKVKLIGNGAGPAQFKAVIAGGVDKAWLAYPSVITGWLLTDQALRAVDGKIPEGYQEMINHLPTYVVDTPEAAEKLAPSYDWEGPANYQEQFKQLWKVTG